MNGWKNYWFKPSPYLDLAILRIVAVGLQIFVLCFTSTLSSQYLTKLISRANLPEEMWNPIILVKLLGYLGTLEWGYRPAPEVLTLVFYLTLAFGLIALFGLVTNVSLFLFAVGNVYLQGNLYSYYDFHHPEAIMMVALSVLALSPCGKILSIDSWIRNRRGSKNFESLLEKNGEFCGWPIKLLQWFFVLMYFSAVWMKLTKNGLDWPNGYTLQYYMAIRGVQGNQLALWLSEQHWLLLVGQWVVLIFQATFALAVIFPRLRIIYVPLGLGFHSTNWLVLVAPFPQWIALYIIFIPWRKVFDWFRGRTYQDRLSEVAPGNRTVI